MKASLAGAAYLADLQVIPLTKIIEVGRITLVVHDTKQRKLLSYRLMGINTAFARRPLSVEVQITK